MDFDAEHPEFRVTYHAAGILVGPCAIHSGFEKDETRFVLNGHKDVYVDGDVREETAFGDSPFRGTVRVDWQNRKITITPRNQFGPIHGTFSF